MTQAEHIISRFGTISALARKLGHKHPTTVQGWKERGWVPADQQPLVLKVGADLEPPLTPQDFFEGAREQAAGNGLRRSASNEARA
ncbi:hypothetical protein D9623_26620 (plasmid) [Azospirillum brasilense]|uniref:YdaS antitoxin of YdaST toxin-antitoxin system n=1 Tax=Azospirillum brasilense TaxID=192 RepID=A0A4D8QTM6_AZOBR|nr:hypothetical protein [Azospirillum brasilense]OPH21620.1 hypothetical protein FE88_08060 [Azospirillum brasilense]QCO12881.1 hypothetical protein D3868_28140 [Azospirillum brasilense]QEL94845.1 hypothetical protein D9621_32460 [Azospirillum brasilense]QEM00005.1 hypothetical protein D9623_26620 [Azospirillum brasilense]